MEVLNIAAYRFVPLEDLETLRSELLGLCKSLNLLGTILISEEGINIMLAGSASDIHTFKIKLGNDSRFAGLPYKESHSAHPPFQKIVVKIKPEIITLGKPVNTPNNDTSHISPATLKQWLDEGRDISLLDTRNDYEVRLGRFENADNLNIRHFREFPGAIEERCDHETGKPVVMYCTGGIRCEKALPYLLSIGYKEIYQLDGGILNYLSQTNGEHWQGECFVFDERVGLNAELQETGTVLCENCQSAVTKEQQESSDYWPTDYCPYCKQSSWQNEKLWENGTD